MNHLAVTKVLPIGNGGVNYAKSNTAQRLKIAQNQANIATNSAFKDTETQRALKVIAQRQAAGQSTDAQEKYLRNNLGYAGTVSAPSAAAPNPTAMTNIPTTVPKTPSQSSQLLDQMRQIASKEAGKFEFSYNKDADPNYQAALASAQRNIEKSNNAIQADTNRRGILNSTITTDRMASNANDTLAALETDVLPGLLDRAYNQQLGTYQTNQNADQQRVANLSALASAYQGQEQNTFNNRISEAGLTGNYLPEGAQNAIDNILSLKQQAEVKGITAQDRAKLSASADAYRAQLLSLGIDPAAYSSAIGSGTAAQANPGIRTLAGKQMDQSAEQLALQKRQANLNAAAQVSQITGRAVTPQDDWQGLFRQAESQGVPLTATQQAQVWQQNYQVDRARVSDEQWNKTFGYQKERDNVADDQYQQNFQYQAARAKISDGQWQQQFDQSVQEFGLNYALQEQIQNGQLTLQEAQDAREQGEYDYKMSGGGASAGVTAEDYNKKYLSGIAKYDDDGKLTNQQQIESSILSSNLSDYEAYRASQLYGIPWKGTIPSPPSPTSNNKTTSYAGTGSSKPTAYNDIISSAAKNTGLDTSWIKAVIDAESSFNPKAGSSAGAQGLMQLMPGTAKGLGVRDSYDPTQNINGGSSLLASEYKKYGSLELALAAYNAGGGRVDKEIKKHGNSWESIKNYLPKETQNYIPKVLKNITKYQQ